MPPHRTITLDRWSGALWGGFLLGLAPQAAGLTHGFYEDDFTWLGGVIRAGDSPLSILAPWKSYEIRTLPQALFYLEYRLFGLHPLGYNLTSLLLHLGCAFLVARLASLAGLTRKLSLASGVLFFAGLGHYAKPMTWACAQVILLGTLFTLWAVAEFLRRRDPTGPRDDRRFPYVPVLLLAAAIASHEIVILAPFGLAFLAYRLRDPRRRSILAVGAAMSLLYGLITLRVHLRHPVASATVITPFWNLVHFPAAFLAPPQIMHVLQRLSPGSRIPSPLFSVWNGLVWVAGVVVVVAAILIAIRTTPPLRRLMAIGLLVFLPVLPMPMPGNWVEARYLYPTSAFLAPALCAGVAGLFRSLSRAKAAALAGALAFWALAILAGSSYMQKQTHDISADPRNQRRLEFIRTCQANPELLAEP